MSILELFLLALSLCADCFAVSICSSISLKDTSRKTVLSIAIVFAVIQAGLLLCGWLFGNVFVGFVEKIAHIIGFVLLLYVGGSMLIEGIRAKGECRNLSGLRNVILGGIATSIDALAVGVSQSMGGVQGHDAIVLCVFVFVVTFLSVVAGINLGRVLGCRGKKFSRIAEIVGGVILIGIGVGILLG